MDERKRRKQKKKKRRKKKGGGTISLSIYTGHMQRSRISPRWMFVVTGGTKVHSFSTVDSSTHGQELENGSLPLRGLDRYIKNCTFVYIHHMDGACPIKSKMIVSNRPRGST